MGAYKLELEWKLNGGEPTFGEGNLPMASHGDSLHQLLFISISLLGSEYSVLALTLQTKLLPLAMSFQIGGLIT